MKDADKWNVFFKTVCRYLTFFMSTAFITTCCMTLFLSAFTANMDITLTEENLNAAAKLTFANVILLSFLFLLTDAIRRRFTIKRPVKAITDAAEKMIRGDFSVRIKPQTKLMSNDAFNEISDCFNRMAQELQGVEALHSDFIANVSHEMKTPLAVIQNYSALLQTPALSDEKRLEYAKAIADCTRKTSDMLTNILKLNRLENQQIFPKLTKFDLGEQLCECLLQYENIWESSQIEIETDIAQSVEINADKELLSLVWNNLLSNAFKFTNRGGTVSVLMTGDEKYVYVKIADTGCGMTAEIGSRIFEKFYQGDTSHSESGNGLGLALVKRVIDIVRGEICVESTVGVGTAFTVKLERGM